MLGEDERRVAARLLKTLLEDADDRSKEPTSAAPTPPSGNQERSTLVERARRTFAGRARRSRNFSAAMFGEAAWDMLLALYVAEQSRAPLGVTGLVSLSGVPPTTGLRWLSFLEEEQLVSRHANPTDRRAVFVKLTDKARDALDAYFSGTVATAP